MAGGFFAATSSAWSQTVLLENTLRDGSLPTGWSQSAIVFETGAGGYARFENIASQLTTPSINASAHSSVEVSFAVAKFSTGDDGPISVEYSLDGGATWNVGGNSGVPTSGTYLENQVVAIPAVSAAMLIRFNRAESPSQKRLRDVVITGVGSSGVTTLSLSLPASVAQGASTAGSVVLSVPLGNDLAVTLSSAAPADLQVPASVTIPQGEVSAEFTISASPLSEPGPNFQVAINGTAAGFDPFSGTILVINTNPSVASLTPSGYSQTFASFVSQETLPAGWSLQASNPAFSIWGNTVTGAKFSSATVNVFGYQHTATTGVVQQILTLRNDTGSEVDAVTISYLGRAFRLSETRLPAYTVEVDGQAVPSLAYSTGDGDAVVRTASVAGLALPPGETVQISWISERGEPAGTSRQIGIGDLSVTVGQTSQPPTVTSLQIPAVSITSDSAVAEANVTSDGGLPLTARGFVFSVSAVEPNPVIGAPGVTNVAAAVAEVGTMTSTLADLDPNTNYAVRAYAINAQGTTYTSAATFRTQALPAPFTGTYFESFNDFEGVGTLAGEWTADSTGGVQNYLGPWASALNSGGFYGGVSDPGVLGYTHTSGSGTLTVSLRLVNNTGAPLTELNVQYLGRVERLDNDRFPAWTVNVGGVGVADLAYSTEPGTDEVRTATVTGLNIPVGEEFSISWSSTRATGQTTGASRRIGVANVIVSTSEIVTPVINIGGTLVPFATTQGAPSAAQTFTASGSNLLGDISVTAPTNFEVSLDNSNFGASVVLPAAGGVVGETTVYVRLAAGAELGAVAGLVAVTSEGALPQNIAVTGTVSPAGGGYDAWAGGFGLDPDVTTGPNAGAPTADPDGDGFTNEQEFAFGTNPTVGNAALLQAAADGSGNLVFTYIERDAGVTYAIETRANLSTGSWLAAGLTPTVSSDQSDVESGYTRKQFIVADPEGNAFYRVRASIQ